MTEQTAGPEPKSKLGGMFRTFRKQPDPSEADARPKISADDISAWIVGRVAQVLAIAPDQLDATKPLSEYGLDSRAAVTLAGDLERWLGCEIDATLAWDHPTIHGMATHLAEKLGYGGQV